MTELPFSNDSGTGVRAEAGKVVSSDAIRTSASF